MVWCIQIYGFWTEKDKTLENMRGILYLSYGDLPSYLKPCLLYLSMFPKDYLIERDWLVRMWVVEGFVDEKQGRNLYKLGERYFIELVNRSMIQPVHMDGNDNATSCRVHDMILDLIISLSAEENFITILESRQLISPVCKVRRLSLQGSEVDNYGEHSTEDKVILPATVNMSHVRSLVALGNAFQWMPPLSIFSVLRVLALAHFPSNNNHPKDIGNLNHLRYLTLRSKFEPKFLKEIGKLQLLKTLDLCSTCIQELPASFVQLRQLENLLIDMGVKLPDGIGNLMFLQQLSWLDVEESPNTLAELGKLTELRVLRVYGLADNRSGVRTSLQSLSHLGNLRTLVLKGHGLCSLDCMPDRWRDPVHLHTFSAYFRIKFTQLPRWFSSLSELSSSSIRVNVLRQDDLQLLGALPLLRFLDLSVAVDGTTEERLVTGSDQPFRSLAEFKFRHYTRCSLVFTQGVMPKVQRLELCFQVPNREGGGFDIGLENLTSLKHAIVIVGCTGTWVREVEDAETMVRKATGILPNHPTVELSRECEIAMAKDENNDDSEASKQQSSDLLAANDENENYIEASGGW